MLKLLLYPFSAIFGLIVSIRNFLYDYKIFKSTEFEIPVISIGNITVGGTGKTPHTEYLVDLLRKQFTVTTISRGYKRDCKNSPPARYPRRWICTPYKGLSKMSAA